MGGSRQCSEGMAVLGAGGGACAGLSCWTPWCSDWTDVNRLDVKEGHEEGWAGGKGLHGTEGGVAGGEMVQKRVVVTLWGLCTRSRDGTDGSSSHWAITFRWCGGAPPYPGPSQRRWRFQKLWILGGTLGSVMVTVCSLC